LSEEQPKPTFFFDGTHGKLIPTVLQAVGLSIRRHRNQGWLDDMLDVDWIAECGKNGWAIISGDKQIARVPEERQAVIDAKCKVFMFDDGHETTTEDWAASLIVARERLIEIVERTNGPLFVTVKRCKVHGHISLPDFIPDTGACWKVKVESKQAISTELTPQEEETKPSSQQQVLKFPPTIQQPEQAIDSADDIIIDIETRRATNPTK
jgi:hypothetical protein